MASTSKKNTPGGKDASNGDAFGQWVVRWRWLVLFGSLAIAVIAGSGASNLAFNNDYRVFFSDDNPEMLAFEKLQRTYTKIDNILFTVAPRAYEVFDPAVLKEYLLITDRINIAAAGNRSQAEQVRCDRCPFNSEIVQAGEDKGIVIE